tara:strand:+ start:150 stop:842 length:693 start_codon:yes stop_codon:yes gene_type:complete
MGEVTRQFKGIWIPADIWLSKELKPIDKVLLADIDSFTGNGKAFYKSNATIAEDLGVSVSTAKRSIKTLLTQNYINISGTTTTRVCTSLIGFKDSGQNEPSKLDEGQNERGQVHNEFNKGQNDPPLGSKCPPTNTITNSVSNSITKKGVPSSQKECSMYFIELGSTPEEAAKFTDWFEQVGWRVKGGNKIKDWKAAARSWTKRKFKTNETKGFNANNFTPEALHDFVNNG